MLYSDFMTRIDMNRQTALGSILSSILMLPVICSPLFAANFDETALSPSIVTISNYQGKGVSQSGSGFVV